MIEFYDYFAFGTATALVFNKVFFPALSAIDGTMASFAIFAIGFFPRPLGAIIWGHFGDRFGRKQVLVATMLVMGLSTVLIGCLPTAAKIGLWAPVLLVVLRLTQGLGLGGEWGGAVVLVVENAEPRHRGFLGSFPAVGNAVGLVLSTGIFALLSATLTSAQFLAWGWRLPFILSIVLVAIGLWVRLRVSETPVYEAVANAARDRTVPIAEVFSRYLRSVTLGVLIRVFFDILGYTVLTFGVFYVTQELGLPKSVGTAGVAITAAVSILVVLLMGWISDRVGWRPIFIGSAILGTLFCIPFFALLDTKSTVCIWIAFVVLYAICNQAPNAVMGPMLATLFPTRIRYTGTGVSYNLESMIGGGPAPFIATALFALGDGKPWILAGYMTILGLATIALAFFARETLHSDISGEVSRRVMRSRRGTVL
jgi:MFS transporter, MHS family, shikimate and dehydroshikimate transport protein